MNPNPGTLMLLLISAALACGPYGSFQTFQPEDNLQVSVIGQFVEVYDLEADAWMSEPIRATDVRRVDVVGEQLVVYGNRGIEFIDLGNLSS